VSRVYEGPFEMWGDEAFLRKVYRMAVDAAADRSMGCALDPNLGQLGLDAYIVRECVFKSKVKECTQFKYFLFFAASNLPQSRAYPSSIPAVPHVVRRGNPLGNRMCRSVRGTDGFSCCVVSGSPRPSPRLGVRGFCVLEAQCTL